MAEQHKHLIIRGEISRPMLSVAEAKAAVVELVGEIDMKLLDGYGQSPTEYINPVASYCEMPGNRGLTAVALIETSCIQFHIWDETNPIMLQCDVYSCSDFELGTVAAWINRYFGTKKLTYMLIDRGEELKLVGQGVIEY